MSLVGRLANRHAVAERERREPDIWWWRIVDRCASGAVREPGLERACSATDGGRGPSAGPAGARLPTHQHRAHEARAEPVAPQAEQAALPRTYEHGPNVERARRVLPS